MPWCKENNILFIHIPKTAGTSIELQLNIHHEKNIRSKYAFQYIHQRQHSTIGHLLHFDLLSQEEINSFFKFSITRNPWDKLVSEYEGHCKTDFGELTFSEFLQRFQDMNRQFFETKEKCYDYEKTRYAGHYSPQYRYIYDKNDNPVLDFLGRFENIDEDWKTICKLANIEYLPLQKFNTSKNRKPYQEYYNESDKKLVQEMFQRDIELFKYTFD